MNRLFFSVLIFFLFGSSFAAAEVDVHEVEEIVAIGSKRSEVLGNAPQKTAERMNASGLGNGHLAESFSYSPGNFASVLFKATPTGRSSGRLMYAYQGDNPNTSRSRESKIGRIALKLLSGTVGGIGAVTLYSNPKSFKRYCILVQLREMEVFVLSNTLDK